MDKDDFSVSGRRVVVVGAARSGLRRPSCWCGRGARATLTESRSTFDQADRLRGLGVDLELGGHRAATLEAADLIVASPGVVLEQPVFDAARARGVQTIGELELAWRWVKGPVIAVTGTKGKSTTTTLVGRMLRAAERRRAGRREHRRAVERASGRVDAGHDPCGRDEQLPARDHDDVPPVDRVVAERRRRPSRSASDPRGLRRSPRRGSSRIRRRPIGRSSTRTTRS